MQMVNDRLTIGVISKNGLPHLNRCLESLPALTGCAKEVEFILVDSASTDDTRDFMLEFAASNPNTRVFNVDGQVNPSVTRNVVLKNAKPGALFLVDGDIAVNADFLTNALVEIKSGQADIVFGKLPEIWHDASYHPYQKKPDRYKIFDRNFVKNFGGIVLLGPSCAASKLLYDETFRRFEDIEFSVRLAEQYRILALPIDMGTHYTDNYYSKDRIKDFYKEVYQRPAGAFIRRNLLNLHRIWWARHGYSGYILGVVLQFLLVLSLLISNGSMTMLLTAIICFDICRFINQKRLREYIPIRVVGAWQLLFGLLFPESKEPSYKVSELNVGLENSVIIQ